MKKSGKIIVLNGPSRAGKSTTASELQRRWLPSALVRISIDDFMHFIPQAFFAVDPAPGHVAEDGLRWVLPLAEDERAQIRTAMVEGDSDPLSKYERLKRALEASGNLDLVQTRGVEIRCGPAIDRLMVALPMCVLSMVEVGCDVVVEHAFFKASWLDAFVQKLSHCDVLFVGLKCPLEVLEEREISGGGRIVGQVRGHHELVHEGVKYDLVFDTSLTPPEEVANTIQKQLGQGNKGLTALDSMLKERV